MYIYRAVVRPSGFTKLKQNHPVSKLFSSSKSPVPLQSSTNVSALCDASGLIIPYTVCSRSRGISTSSSAINASGYAESMSASQILIEPPFFNTRVASLNALRCVCLSMYISEKKNVTWSNVSSENSSSDASMSIFLQLDGASSSSSCILSIAVTYWPYTRPIMPSPPPPMSSISPVISLSMLIRIQAIPFYLRFSAIISRREGFRGRNCEKRPSTEPLFGFLIYRNSFYDFERCTPLTSIIVSPCKSSSESVTNSYPCDFAVFISVGKYSFILKPLLWQSIMQPE